MRTEAIQEHASSRRLNARHHEAAGSDGSPRPPSPALFRFFAKYARGYVRRHFHAVRMSGAPPALPPGASADVPVVVYLNHPSWWDPITCFLVAERFFPTRPHYAAIDAKALERYGLFRRLGFFGVEPGTHRGAAQFLRGGLSVLARPGAMLWVTAEGTFRDARERPVRLAPGLAHLLPRVASPAVVLPLAVEYPFWQERTPELLVRFGEPLNVAPGDPRPADEWQHALEQRLERAMDDLRAAAVRQQPAAFETLLGGRAGVGGVYDLWRRSVAFVRGRKFVAEHGGKS
jgi:1-acyl-sn-glycerol-3-phosphate acyltransferase